MEAFFRRLHTTVYVALQIMADHDIGAVAVVESERLLGIFSERDYARKIILPGGFRRTRRSAK